MEASTKEVPERSEKRTVMLRKKTSDSFQAVFEKAIGEIMSREKADIMRKADSFFLEREGEVGDFMKWVKVFYEEHEDFARKKFTPALQSLSESVSEIAKQEKGYSGNIDEMDSFLDSYADSFVGRHNRTSKRQIQNAIEGDDKHNRLQQKMDSWGETRAKSEAQDERIRATSAVTQMTWIVAGITRITWTAVGKSCPYCNAMDGRTVGIKKHFMKATESMTGTDGTTYTAQSNIGHPPLHGGCDCMIS